jgi:hypothetical protein
MNMPPCLRNELIDEKFVIYVFVVRRDVGLTNMTDALDIQGQRPEFLDRAPLSQV